MNPKTIAAIMLVALGIVALPCPVGAYSVLVFSKTASFRHDSIPAGIAAIQQLGASNNFTVTATEDSAVFTDAGLAPYQAVVFLNTSGDILNQGQQDAFTRYIQAGHGFVGVHAASDTEFTWPWFGALIGAYFKDHPAIQTATFRVQDFSQPSTSFLPAAWVRNDELYNFTTNPRTNGTGIHVLVTLDESTYSGGSMGADHPIAWYHAYAGGRAWYTGGGHAISHYSEPLFRAHLLGGIQYAAAAGVVVIAAPIMRQPTLVGNGSFKFVFNNPSLANFTVLTSTNLATPVTNWTVLGTPTLLSNDVYQFTDSSAGGFTRRYYRLRSP